MKAGIVARVKDDPHQILADNMRRLRAERGWSQELLGEKAGIHRTYIGSVERLERNPSVASLKKIARALGVETWELLFPTGKKLRR